MGGFSLLKQNNLAFKLSQIHIRELNYLKYLPCDVYTYDNEEFQLLIRKGLEITKDMLKRLIYKGHFQFFVHYEDHELLMEAHRENLRRVTRALSVGDPLKNAVKLTGLLTLNLSFLYRAPQNDAQLYLQYQSVKNICHFLLKNPKIQTKLYQEVEKLNFHYTYTQPLLSSILLLSFLKHTYHFSEREIENLFIASYFKDIGMALIPEETFSKKKLTHEERVILGTHAQKSAQILAGRIPLGPSYLDIIRNHHINGSSKINLVGSNFEESAESLLGIETMLVNIMDTISAMTTERPYREKATFFDALELIKYLIATQYPQEFKLLVQFFQQFFK